MKNIREFIPRPRGKQRVYVIGGYDELIKVVSLAIEVAKGVFHDLPESRRFQAASTVSLIEPVFQPFGESFVILPLGALIVRLGMLHKPLLSFRVPLLQ